MKVVKYYADWCGPCKAMTPELARFVSDNNIELEEVNIEVDSQAAQAASIRSIPTLVVLDDDGAEVARYHNVQALRNHVNGGL